MSSICFLAGSLHRRKGDQDLAARWLQVATHAGIVCLEGQLQHLLLYLCTSRCDCTVPFPASSSSISAVTRLKVHPEALLSILYLQWEPCTAGLRCLQTTLQTDGIVGRVAQDAGGGHAADPVRPKSGVSKDCCQVMQAQANTGVPTSHSCTAGLLLTGLQLQWGPALLHPVACVMTLLLAQNRARGSTACHS